MTYLLIRVHSYTCDHPGCGAEEEHAEPNKRAADSRMRRANWFITPVCDFCPKHRPDRVRP